jgi:dihydropyrimidine dehydrogenase (NAD+) subunit PreT
MTPGKRVHWLPIALGVGLVALTAWLLYRGWSFYALSLEDRVDHPAFHQLRPSGTWGNGYGWIAAVLVVFNLSYLVRRRIGGARLGSMKIWLDVHVFTGLFAATLATFHSAFQLRTPITQISAGSLGIVVITGLVGRFLYALTPANDRARLRDAIEALEAHRPGHRDEIVQALESLPGLLVPANASLPRSLLAIPKWRRIGRARRAALARIIPPSSDRVLRRAARHLAAAAAAEAGSSGKSALLRSWRGLHRFFALLMLASVLLHGGVAWYFGYRWIFA